MLIFRTLYCLRMSDLGINRDFFIPIERFSVAPVVDNLAAVPSSISTFADAPVQPSSVSASAVSRQPPVLSAAVSSAAAAPMRSGQKRRREDPYDAESALLSLYLMTREELIQSKKEIADLKSESERKSIETIKMSQKKAELINANFNYQTKIQALCGKLRRIRARLCDQCKNPNESVNHDNVGFESE